MAAAVVKPLPDGRISLDISKLGHLLNEAVLARLMDEPNEVVKAVLQELRTKLSTTPTRVKLRRSEWLALMEPATMSNLDHYEQAYLLSVLMPSEYKKRTGKRTTIFP